MRTTTLLGTAFALGLAGCASASSHDDLGRPHDLSVPSDLTQADSAIPDLLTPPDLTTFGDGSGPADLARAIDLSSPDGGTLPASGLVISQIRSRGAGGASDEFIELYNPTAAAVTLDASWSVDGRSSAAASFSKRWTGAGQSLPAHGHLLLGGTAYTQTPTADAALTSGITDAGALRLIAGGAPIDVVCYAFNATTRTILTADATYGCPGTPADNAPHDNTASAASNVDQSIERKPGGAGGNGTSSGDNSADFVKRAAATPRNLASAPAP